MTESKTVLVTGLSGFVAAHIGLDLLKKGYRLHGTSRSAKSLQPLLDGIYKPYAEHIKIFEVPDITLDGAFDEAAKGRLSNPSPQLTSQVLTE
jgi:nucleoside-diphosphate-sugar epimerase